MLPFFCVSMDSSHIALPLSVCFLVVQLWHWPHLPHAPRVHKTQVRVYVSHTLVGVVTLLHIRWQQQFRGLIGRLAFEVDISEELLGGW